MLASATGARLASNFRVGAAVFVFVFVFGRCNRWARRGLLILWTGQEYLYLFLYLYLTTGGLFQFDGRGRCPVGVTLPDMTRCQYVQLDVSRLAWELFLLSFLSFNLAGVFVGIDVYYVVFNR